MFKRFDDSKYENVVLLISYSLILVPKKMGSLSGLEIMVLYLMVCKEFGKFKEVSEHIVSNCGYMLLSFSVSIAQFGQEV